MLYPAAVIITVSVSSPPDLAGGMLLGSGGLVGFGDHIANKENHFGGGDRRVWGVADAGGGGA